jgi:uncharacterized protein
VIAILGLEPLDKEGGHWGQTWIDGTSTAIYFLLQPGDFSAFHQAGGVEHYHFYGGSPAELCQLNADGTSTSVVLGMDLGAGQRPFRSVPADAWQGSRTLGPWTLLGAAMAPPFSWDRFQLGGRATLMAAYPDRAAEIMALTRS